MQEILDKAVAAQDVPFAVAMHADAGGVKGSSAAGEARQGTPASSNTVFRIFSMTKAVGSTAAMQLIDRGRLSFDTPVADLLPDFGKLQVLESFNGSEPRLRPAKQKATIRHLATHTSGLAYEFWDADVARYLEATGQAPVLSGLRAGLDYPLTFDPGERWSYGLGIDWLGQVVEAVDGRRIDQYCQEELFEPLAMNHTAFEVSDSMQAELADVVIRGEDGQFTPFELAPPANPEVYGMGHALYSTAPDYIRFLRMFLNKGQLDGNRVLSEKATDDMLANHMGSLRIGKLTSAAPAVTADVDLSPGTEKTHSFGFLRTEQDVPGMRSAGSQGWAGVLNSHYWFDPKKNVAAVIMTQSLPFVEPRFMALYEAYERAVYAG